MDRDVEGLPAGDVNDLLRQGIVAAKSGQRERARDLLMRVVQEDEGSVLAWLWLSGVVDSLEDREVCLENVLTLDPDNAAARRGLALLRRQKIDGWLRQGIAAAKSGQRERARDLLMRVVQEDEGSVLAWLWLGGVVDSLEDREVCLENVLALDPGNEAARRGLALVRERKGAQASSPGEAVGPPVAAPESPAAMRASAPVSAAAAVLSEDFARRGPPPEPEAPSVMAQDEFDDEYLCPYCTAPTEPEDRKCGACGGKLWITYRRQEERSAWLWVVLVLQFLSTLQSAVPPLVLSLLVFGVVGDEPSARPVDVYVELANLLGVSAAVVKTWMLAGFIVALVLFLFSLAVLVGLYLRWKPAFYFVLVGAVLELFWTVAAVVMSFSPASDLTLLGGAGYVCMGFVVLAALAKLWVVFQTQDDFALERRRIIFRIDPNLSGVSGVLARGHEYAERKMWGLAALHMRRAVAFAPEQLSGRGALTLAYLKLKRYDLAAKTLAEARRIRPDDPRLEELQTLLDDARSAGDAP